MLTEEMKRTIEAECSRCRNRHSACIEALQTAQSRWGWISDEGIREIADLLHMNPAELDAVATFYNHIFRKPVGKHVILLCDSVTCWVLGYEKLLEHISARLGIKLGETTADGLFTILPIQCLGSCEAAPALMIDETLYTDITPERFDEIVNNYRQSRS